MVCATEDEVLRGAFPAHEGSQISLIFAMKIICYFNAEFQSLMQFISALAMVPSES